MDAGVHPPGAPWWPTAGTAWPRLVDLHSAGSGYFADRDAPEPVGQLAAGHPEPKAAASGVAVTRRGILQGVGPVAPHKPDFLALENVPVSDLWFLHQIGNMRAQLLL